MIEIPKIDYDYGDKQIETKRQALPIDLPETDDIEELCRAATPQAIRRLCEIALDDTASAGTAVSAIKEILDRGHGKAQQNVNVKGTLTLAALVEQSMLPAQETQRGPLPDIEAEIIDASPQG